MMHRENYRDPFTSKSHTYHVLRCSDRHDYLLFFDDPNVAGITIKTGRANIYKIAGRVAVIPPEFWPGGINPCTNISGSTVDDRDVSHSIRVQSIQRL